MVAPWILAMACTILTCDAAEPPSVETLKASLTQKLDSLKPALTERNVIFLEVRGGAQSGEYYPFLVTLIIRDFGHGPAGRGDFGRTCVIRLENVGYTLSRGPSGGWQVDGLLKPPPEEWVCKANPAAGESSIPPDPAAIAAVLADGAAPQGAGPARASSTPAPAETPARLAIPPGRYECWANGERRPLLNLTVRQGGQYSGSDGKPGAFLFDPKTGRITFKGGYLDGIMPPGFYALFVDKNGVPTVSFRNPHGLEASYCQRPH